MTEENRPMIKEEELTTVEECELRDVKEFNSPPAEEEKEERQTFDPDKDFSIGYMIGIQNDSKIYWRIFGHDQDLAGLLGIHNIAVTHIEAEKNVKLMTGDALIRQLINITQQLAQQVATLTQQMNQPTNKL